ncbi:MULTISPECIES: SRPBCC family protein [unclassified Streptomyces]|uniref:SRPBCC family protein n=1 Tax=unclassified Streptomyces TaxID=2593676 RepID=UPI0036E033F4
MYDAVAEDDDGPDVHWPPGFAPDQADCYCRAQTTVSAPASQVFDLLVTAEDWPGWVPGLTDVRFRGPCQGTLQKHGAFEVRLANRRRFELLVAEIAAPRRLGLSGIATGLQFYQAWLLTPSSTGTVVSSEIVARGIAAKAMREATPDWASRVNSRWLAGLRARAETV